MDELRLAATQCGGPMNQFLVDIKAMHAKFKIPERHTPGFIDTEYMKFRLNFLLEELVETANACGFRPRLDPGISGSHAVSFESFHHEENLEEALDGLVDLMVVLCGTINIMGMGYLFDEAWDRVLKSNMQKERVEDPTSSKRGFIFDLRKPEGWKKPEFKDLLP